MSREMEQPKINYAIKYEACLQYVIQHVGKEKC